MTYHFEKDGSILNSDQDKKKILKIERMDFAKDHFFFTICNMLPFHAFSVHLMYILQMLNENTNYVWFI